MTRFKHIVFFIVLVLISCTDSKLKNASLTKSDVIQQLFNQSQRKDLEVSQKLQFIDSAFALTKDYPVDTLTLEIIYQKSNLHYNAKQRDSSYYYDKKLLTSSIELNHLFYKGKASQALAYHFKTNHVNDSAYYYYNLSKNSFQNLKDSSQVGRRLLTMSQIQQNQNDYFGSKETIIEATQYFHPKKDLKYISSAWNELATSHRKLLNYSDAIKYYNQAISTTNSEKDKLIYQNNLAATFIDNQEYKKAISLLNTISQDSLLITAKKEYARVLDNLAYAKWLSGDAFTEKEFQESLKLRKQNNDLRGQIASYTHLGECYSKVKPKKAEAYFDSVIQLSKKIKIPRAEKDALKFLMTLKPKSISIRDRYVFLQDSLYQQETKVKTQFAKYKYDDKQKQEDILRLEKENAEKELETSQQRNQKTRSYAISAFLLLISSFITYFFVQRSKRLKEQNKTAKLEATYETEANLSRKLHDDFGGKLNHAMVLLQSEANNEEVLDIVDGLYNQSRDFSREINDVDTGPNFKNFLFGMMGSYCKKEKLMTTGSAEVDWLKLSALSKKTLFKILQELMINMQKHSDANLVSVVFEQTKKKLKVAYADDGVGASTEELNLKNGLWNTEKRIEAIGGTIIFDSEKGSGFQAQIELPN